MDAIQMDRERRLMTVNTAHGLDESLWMCYRKRGMRIQGKSLVFCR